MTTETMNIHKALSEVKILNSHIEKAINNKWCITVRGNATIFNGVSADEYISTIKSAYASVTDLIKRRNALKNAISESNAKTKVKINGEEFTVAAAIDFKVNGIYNLSTLLTSLNTAYNGAIVECERKNANIAENADKFVASTIGDKDTASTDDINNTRESYITANTYHVVDPLSIAKEIKAVEAKINGFQSEVDSALSVSNALTEITINY